MDHEYAKYIRTAQGHLSIRVGEDSEGNVLYHRSDITTRENVTYAVIQSEGIVAMADDIVKEAGL